jgi:hypothetical protein
MARNTCILESDPWRLLHIHRSNLVQVLSKSMYYGPYIEGTVHNL